MSASWQRWLWLGLALALNLAALTREGWHNSAVPAAAFTLPQPVRASPASAAPVYRDEFIDPQSSTPVVHVSSLCELPGGRLAATWYGGSDERARDVAVYFATREAGDAHSWAAPRALVTRQSAAQETYRFVKGVGNAVLFGGTDSHLYLLYVSIAVGGWSGSSLNLKESFDGGQSWTPSRRLGLSPLLNISELAKNGPTRLTDAGWAVPVYQEMVGTFPELLWLHATPGGLRAVKSRPFGGSTAFQPALVALDSHRALLFCRTASSVHETYLARTDDAGRHWTPPQPIGLPSPDSGLDALRLNDGRILLAFNDTTKGKDILRLALSSDEAVTWRRVATLSDDPKGSFAYPFLLQTQDGLVHATYTWKRRGIKHVSFNLAWLEAPDRGHSP